jgi:RNA polymerase sigma factor (sigma-70 family)
MSGGAAKVTTGGPDPDGFGTTAWSLVLAAGQDDDGGHALERLCRRHWRPLYVFIRASGFAPADAEDATQDFFVYLFEKDWIRRADPKKGSFRSFLLTLLRNFLANYRRRSRAEKRRPAATDAPLDADDAERELASLSDSGGDPAAAYEASWARGVLQASLSRLAEEQAAAGKAALFEALRPFVSQSPEAGDYERLSRDLGLRRGQIALSIHRLARRFAELIRIEVADTLADRSELEAELRHLLTVSGA